MVQGKHTREESPRIESTPTDLNLGSPNIQDLPTTVLLTTGQRACCGTEVPHWLTCYKGVICNYVARSTDTATHCLGSLASYTQAMHAHSTSFSVARPRLRSKGTKQLLLLAEV